MANFTLEEVCCATGGTKLGQVNLTEFTGVYTDSRKVVPGSLFVALKGENFDGHAFIADVIAKGAAAVIVDRPVASTVTTILCANTLKALQDLAAFHRRRFAIPVIAITGSNGKTTTKDMLAAILAEKWNVVKTPGNYNNEIGLPLTLLALTSETQVAVVEMGMRGRGQIAELAAIAAPTAAIVTTVGETHIELLGSLDNIAAAKAELVEAIAADGFVVLNNDNPYVAAMDSVAKAPVATFGLAETASVRA
ncbi:MAG: UDP-N-acetylmuramoyl-tripeptide--D-alanyl-D-alanine ligase, partial [Sporomusaceae bacterium]|nr:UDP-N-acetylmuramoyl-tripeptide--D-alanyl-D-alanine ligase [Sporomusaceae bacterium]